jgi:hypothetical protein
MTTDDFEVEVRNWVDTTRHPTTGKLFTEMVFQPMLELLAYLLASGFKTFIVSGGGIEFMRAFAEVTYGVPPEQVIGSSGKLKFEMRDGQPTLSKLPESGRRDGWCALRSPRPPNDAIREFSYDRTPSIGQLDKALDEATAKCWTVVDMKNDWRRVFPFE